MEGGTLVSFHIGVPVRITVLWNIFLNDGTNGRTKPIHHPFLPQWNELPIGYVGWNIQMVFQMELKPIRKQSRWKENRGETKTISIF